MFSCKFSWKHTLAGRSLIGHSPRFRVTPAKRCGGGNSVALGVHPLLIAYICINCIVPFLLCELGTCPVELLPHFFEYLGIQRCARFFRSCDGPVLHTLSFQKWIKVKNGLRLSKFYFGRQLLETCTMFGSIFRRENSKKVFNTAKNSERPSNISPRRIINCHGMLIDSERSPNPGLRCCLQRGVSFKA